MKKKQKYLLSTGLVTDKVEYYIIDLFKLYLSIYPGDIPGFSSLGFDFIITNTMKDELKFEIRKRLEDLIKKIKNSVSSVDIKISEAYLISEDVLKLIIEVNDIKSDEILIDLYKNNK